MFLNDLFCKNHRNFLQTDNIFLQTVNYSQVVRKPTIQIAQLVFRQRQIVENYSKKLHPTSSIQQLLFSILNGKPQL